MQLESQCCSLELAKRLKELGVKQESIFWWVDPSDGTRKEAIWFIRDNHVGYKDHASALTVAELGEMLPIGTDSFKSHQDDGEWLCVRNEPYAHVRAMSEADARAKMLAHLLENKLITL